MTAPTPAMLLSNKLCEMIAVLALIRILTQRTIAETKAQFCCGGNEVLVRSGELSLVDKKAILSRCVVLSTMVKVML
jgi:iron-sulfur cluster repair protein YtfE (RIC family)